MSVSFRTISSSLPDRLRQVLEMRESNFECPVDVARALATISYFREEPKPAAGARGLPLPPVSRFANLDRQSDDWRSGGRSQGYADRRGPKTDDGFEVWNGNRRRAPRVEGRYEPRQEPRYEPRNQVQAEKPVVAAEAEKSDVSTEVSNTKFSSAGVKTSAKVEDRMLARVKGKINKIGVSTYEATKVFMQQILDSEDTGFLDDFMKFVFLKAATESAFCSLYAKLLHELADEFTHLRTVMVSLFRDYISIFAEVEGTADVGTADYREFLEAQERKKFRRGYSQFVAELVKLGEANTDDFTMLIHTIVGVIEANHGDAAKTLLCEEYIDCLANLCKGAPAILMAADWSEPIRKRLDALAKKPRTDVPGLTNKGRFALMDLVDSAARGWK